MMKIVRCGFVAMLALVCEIACAYTECPPIQLTKIWNDVDGNFFVATGGYLNGIISPTAKPAIAVAIAAIGM